MITFAGGTIDTDTLYHENMHQWWGDHVTEGGYTMTFYKEGLATLAEYFYHARTAEAKAGGPGTRAGQAAFQASLVAQFNRLYARTASFWTLASRFSIPTPALLIVMLKLEPTPSSSRLCSCWARRRSARSAGFAPTASSPIRRWAIGSRCVPEQLWKLRAWERERFWGRTPIYGRILKLGRARTLEILLRPKK